MNVERLKTLSDFLKDVSEDNFDMTMWAYSKRETLIDMSSHLHDPYSQSECGFAACAMGWACQIPSFVQQGLHLTRGYPSFGSHMGHNAACDFFEIDMETSYYLFSGRQYCRYYEGKVTPKMVAKRIDNLILGHVYPKCPQCG